MYESILTKISSICTDGANVNNGEKGGLWKFFEDELLKCGNIIALNKIWCAAHRSDLCFEISKKNFQKYPKSLAF